MAKQALSAWNTTSFLIPIRSRNILKIFLLGDFSIPEIEGAYVAHYDVLVVDVTPFKAMSSTLLIPARTVKTQMESPS
ncbi:hypothetical protein [Bacteriovorax sp. BSW11_IV]|uniref:hypothetical protein n=1 Tax=Bacteriovorax sp. BSW11_IV TaxID=1353529 RepID=UPI0018CAC24C|nr:hypothetical protein [Bacteriovorax sp. BSW11_IV]